MKTLVDDLEQQLRTYYQQHFGEPSPLSHLLSRLDGRLPAQEEAQTSRKRLPRALSTSRLFAPSAPRLVQTLRLAPRRFIALAAVLLIVLVSSGVLAFSAMSHTGKPVHLVLIPTGQASSAELATTRAILSQRFSSFGLQNVGIQLATVNGNPEILVDFLHFGGDETSVINTLTERGVLEFWDTGATPMKVGTQLDPGQYTQENPGSSPRFTGQDLDPNQIYAARDSTGRFGVNFAMRSSSSRQFYLFTQQYTGSFLTITLDKKVLVSAVIQAGINGTGAISDNFTQQQANALVADLKYGSLPIALQQQQ